MKFTKLFSLIIIPLSLFSCNLDNENSDIAEEIKIAESVIYNFKQYSVKKGKIQYIITADKAETFEEDDKTIIYNMTFSQFDKEKKEVATGKAEKVEYNVESENAIIDGDVIFTSKTEGVSVSSTWLDWNNEKKILKGKNDVPVKLEKESGTILEGKGFQAEVETKTISFSNGMKGVFVPENKKDDKDEEK